MRKPKPRDAHGFVSNIAAPASKTPGKNRRISRPIAMIERSEKSLKLSRSDLVSCSSAHACFFVNRNISGACGKASADTASDFNISAGYPHISIHPTVNFDIAARCKHITIYGPVTSTVSPAPKKSPVTVSPSSTVTKSSGMRSGICAAGEGVWADTGACFTKNNNSATSIKYSLNHMSSIRHSVLRFNEK